MLTLVIPVYKNERNIDSLVGALERLLPQVREDLEVVFVVDGSPDRSLERLRERLPQTRLNARVVVLARNFGAFSAIAAGMSLGSGEHFAVMAADLQEPPELVVQFAEILQRDEADVVFGHRIRRTDPLVSTLFSALFWWIYRRWVLPDMPKGGVDVFGCTRRVRDELLKLPETNTNLIAQLFWLGFRRKFVGYERQERKEGKSAWTTMKKLRYSLDSIFSFTDLPLLALLLSGVAGMLVAVVAGTFVLVGRFLVDTPVRGYTPVVLAITFFGGLSTFALGIVGQYVRLAMENARRRPNFIIEQVEEFSDRRSR